MEIGTKKTFWVIDIRERSDPRAIELTLTVNPVFPDLCVWQNDDYYFSAHRNGMLMFSSSDVFATEQEALAKLVAILNGDKEFLEGQIEEYEKRIGELNAEESKQGLP